ncbi:MAG: adenylyltransferase/cytidyltransferase family protein [Treponema sp.]|nr:adenylyltransferase/cytidyltransferase family protein [Treponema sp.]
MADDMNKIGHYKVGYICGVYDLFHAGHLAILRRCKEHCDYLIVGINSDNLTETSKKKRPVINEKDRMDIVGSIRYVDEVVLVDFHNHSPELAWSLYHFDVQFCGDDHEKELQVQKKWLQERGSDLVFFPYTKRVSTTKLRQQLKK